MTSSTSPAAATSPPSSITIQSQNRRARLRSCKTRRNKASVSTARSRIAVNASIDLKRRASARRLASLDAARDSGSPESGRFDVHDDATEMPSQTASRRELEAEIQRAIDRLSVKLRSIIVLRYNENLTYEEIAETLKISLGTVKSRLSRAHDALDRELTPVLDKHYLG